MPVALKFGRLACTVTRDIERRDIILENLGAGQLPCPGLCQVSSEHKQICIGMLLEKVALS